MRGNTLFFSIDAIVMEVGAGQVRNKPIYVVIGVTAGARDILGLWPGDGGEGMKSGCGC